MTRRYAQKDPHLDDLLRNKDERTPYQTFARSLQVAQAPYKRGLNRAQWSQEQLDQQNRQIPELIAAERRFIDAVASIPRLSTRVFGALCEQGTPARKEALARICTRERNVVFVREVVPALARSRLDLLPGYAWNWALLRHTWGFVAARREVAEELKILGCASARVRPAVRLPEDTLETMLEATRTVAVIRRDLVVTNLQLVVDRALAFHRCTPQTLHASEMDMVAVGTEGMLAGVDKVMVECRPAAHWEPSWHPVAGFAYWRGQSAAPVGSPFSLPAFESSGYRVEGHHTVPKHEVRIKRVDCPASVFRTTAIGRMGGRLIQSYSQTHMHLGPDDKRLLYQANRVAARFSASGTPDYEGMARQILLDRIAWSISKKARIKIGPAAAAVAAAYKRHGEAPDCWARMGRDLVTISIRDEEATEVATAPEIVAKAVRKAPTAQQVSAVMLASSSVSAVDDEGEDRLNEAASYAAPATFQPDVAVEQVQEATLLQRALEVLNMLERKLLVLLGFAPRECVYYPFREQEA